MVLDGKLIISGLQFGNVIVTVQPKRGCYGAKCTGEALLAKRRINSVITNHLPSAFAGTDEKTAELARLIDEYQKAVTIDNGHAQILKRQIAEKIKEIPSLSESGLDCNNLDLLRGEIRKTDAARLVTLEQHVFGENPSDEEIRRYIDEAGGDEDGYIERGLRSCKNELDGLICGLSGGYIPAGEGGRDSKQR